MALAPGETCLNKKVGCRSVVSQNQITWVMFDIFQSILLVLICTLENGLAVPNVTTILIPFITSSCETTELVILVRDRNFFTLVFSGYYVD